ncbi:MULTISPECIES: hypothetical protein [Nocardia]|uniref:Uncharacterized protein n=1 Tax=Nocardia sputorum TaxID=2984338 RepID=A0ABN6UEM5_9NOCA|nr:hypothetical protein [Nocardia sputorum]BDT92999.1 hypothetical protein IFM12275_29750 [Nocardia sputorum]BDU03674.1 hypothetical protein IFM12276_67020 [Nocardia sputorum]
MRTTDCSSCESAFDHCHGTLIVHASRIAECTDEHCLELSHARHAFVLDCRDLAGGCRCTDEDTVRRRA